MPSHEHETQHGHRTVVLYFSVLPTRLMYVFLNVIELLLHIALGKHCTFTICALSVLETTNTSLCVLKPSQFKLLL